MADEWRQTLQDARQRVGLSQAELARRASLSVETVRAYEEGRRRPRLKSLTSVLHALKLERGERNRILMSAGFAPNGVYLGPDVTPGYMLTLDEAAEMAERYRWPAFVLDEFMEVVAANRVAQRLWGVDLRREFTGPLERNLLGVASNPRFADRCVNWGEAVGVMVAVFKGHHRGPESLDEPSAYFSAVLERFLQGDPKYVSRFLRLWETTPPQPHKVRWTYPVVWQEPGIGRLHFQSFASIANEPEGLVFNDWIPLDAATWDALDALARRR